DANVCLAHYNCIAGLCNACSHLGALGFAIEAGVLMRDSVTDPRERANVQATTAEKQAYFFESISNCEIKPAILSIIAPYNAAFVPTEKKTTPKPLTEQLNEENFKTTLQELLKKSDTTSNELKLGIKKAETVEEATRDQFSASICLERTMATHKRELPTVKGLHLMILFFLSAAEKDCEIKCPYKNKDAMLCQLFVTGVEYCDFVVWTTKDMFVQHVLPGTEFWDSVDDGNTILQERISPKEFRTM
ncbi:unnamed protein product, partial [Porites lobata]